MVVMTAAAMMLTALTFLAIVMVVMTATAVMLTVLTVLTVAVMATTAALVLRFLTIRISKRALAIAVSVTVLDLQRTLRSCLLMGGYHRR